MLNISSLWVKELQSYRTSNFEDDSTPGVVESGPNTIAHSSAAKAKAADFFLRPPTLAASKFKAL